MVLNNNTKFKANLNKNEIQSMGMPAAIRDNNRTVMDEDLLNESLGNKPQSFSSTRMLKYNDFEMVTRYGPL